jgi:ribosomal protein L29
MAKNDEEQSSMAEIEAAKKEFMRIRFRRVLGESVPAHLIKNTRKNIAKCVRSRENGANRDV